MGTFGRVRAQSSVIGYVLIIGMVITSATLIAFTGASVMDQYRELAGQESTTNAVEEIDTRLSSVASVGGLTRAEFSIGDARPEQYRIVRYGHVNVTANRNPSCRAHIPLSSLRYERDDGVTIGYEGGAIWRQRQGVVSQTAMHAPPDFTFENGTLSLTVIDVNGTIDGSENVVYENVSRSIATNQNLEDSLFTGECARPDNVTVTVKSDFYRGWSGYLRSSMDGSGFSTYDGNETTRVFFEQEKLPEILNDSRNRVVDLNSSEFNDVTVTNSSIKVNKSANNTYTTIVTPLTRGSTQVGQIRTVEGGAVYRPPLDVVFVVDESGSMDYETDGDGIDNSCGSDPSCVSRMDEAKVAARAFVGKMNSSSDRVGLVGYNNTENVMFGPDEPASYFHPTADGEFITRDFGSPGGGATDGINGSINALANHHGTNMGAGVHKGNVLFGLQSNSSRNKVMILLADGENDNTGLRDDAFDEAEIAAKEGITIHTIGFGSLSADANNTMETIAQTSGGTYRHVDDSGDLTQVFEDLFAEISQSKQITLDPVSLQLEAGGSQYFPQIDGDTGHIANGTNGELNVNDPKAPTNYSFSIDVSDGENVSMTARDYECEEDSWEATGRIFENNSTGQEYAEVRCTDINESTLDLVEPSRTSVYLDGQNVSTLLAQPSNWWNEDLKNETLAPYLVGPNNDTLDLKSNSAIVVFEFDDGDGGTDRLIAHYRIGQSTEDAVPRHVFNLEVRHLVIGDES